MIICAFLIAPIVLLIVRIWMDENAPVNEWLSFEEYTKESGLSYFSNHLKNNHCKNNWHTPLMGYFHNPWKAVKITQG